jgi:aminopeptidase N
VRYAPLIAASLLACGEPIAQMQPEIPRPPEPMSALALEPRGIDVLHYDLDFVLPPGNKTLEGDAKIRVAVIAPITELVLDFVGYELSIVTVDSATASYTRDEDRLRIAAPLSSGEHEVHIRYAGKPTLRRNDAGRYDIILGFQGFEESALPESTHYTQNQPNGARLWFPGVDHPSDKATLQISVAVADPLIALANGTLASSERFTRDDVAYTRYTYVSEHPIATYLAHVSVGALRSDRYDAGGVEVINYFPNNFDADAVRRALAPVEIALPMFSELYGEFPFEHYGHLIVADGEPMTAMENQTVTLLDAMLVEEAHHEIIELVLVHELSHSWMGNLLTPADHHHYWFSEGLALFSELVYLERTSTDFSRVSRMTGEWRERRQSFWKRYRNDGAVLALPDHELLGPMAYVKGALIFVMLRNVIGEDALFGGLRLLIRDHAYGNVDTEDVRAAMEEASGGDLGWFFNQWVYDRGFPIIRYGCAAKRVDGYTQVQVDCTFQQAQIDHEANREHWAELFDTIPEHRFPLYRLVAPVWFERPSEFGHPNWLAAIEAVEVQTISTCLDAWPVAIGVDPLRTMYAEWVPGLAVEESPWICER